MKLLDNISIMVDSGIDYAGKKAEVLKLQADLVKINKSLESAYAALGRSIMMREGTNESFLAMYGQQLSAVRELERHAAETRERIDDFSQIQDVHTPLTKTVPEGCCPTCGASVPIDAMFCPSCGGDLAALKANFTKCPSCGAIYSRDTVFCIECGSRVKPLLETDSKPDRIQPEQPAMINQSGVPEQEPSVHPLYEPPSAAACPNCGEPVDVDDLFCGLCGTRLKQ